MSDEPEKPAAGAPDSPPAPPAPSEAPAVAKPAAAPRPAPPPEDPNKPLWEKDPIVPDWKDAWDDPVAAALKEEFGERIESARTFAGDLTLQIQREAIAEVAASLRTKHKFTYLVDVCGADYPKRTPRFDVVYHAHSFEANRRIRLRVMTDEATPVPTVCNV